MSTIEEVQQHFGTARLLSESVLGYPVSGGHATRRTVRAVGRLLAHRLGPALCAEALTWAASVAGSIDSVAVEILLEQANEAEGAFQPWTLDQRPAALDAVVGQPTLTSRRQAILDMWNRSRQEFLDLDSLYVRDTAPGQCDVWGAPREDDPDDLAAWLRSTGHQVDVSSMSQMDPVEQRRLIECANLAELEGIARSDQLFDLDDAVVATCLLKATRTTLRNRACPAELAERVRYPYDLATLKLALRAGPDCYERARVRRMLSNLQEERLLTLLEAEPIETMEAMRDLGLVNAEELALGQLHRLDLRDRRTCRALFGTMLPGNLDVAFEVMLHHPHPEGMAWLLDDAPIGTLGPDQARLLVDRGCPSIAKAAMRHVPIAQLQSRDWELATRCGIPWMAACPGQPAVNRPGMPESFLADHARTMTTGSRIWYPDSLLELDDARFGEAPGWHVSLPKTVRDIQKNAKLMRNCTATMIDDVLDGSLFLVIVHDPRGRRFNVEVTTKQGRFVVGQVQGWANRGGEPPWIRSAFTSRLNNRDDTPGLRDNQCAPTRSPTPHRDRRRARSRAARRRRR